MRYLNHITPCCLFIQVPPFESLLVQYYPQLQAFLVNCLHEKKIVSFLDIIRSHFCSCPGPRVGTWLLSCFTTLAFHLSSIHFFIALHIHCGLPHPIAAHLSRCKCGRTIDGLRTHLFQCLCGSEHTTTHDTFRDFVSLLFWRVENMFKRRSPTFSLSTPNDKWISLSQDMAFEP